MQFHIADFTKNTSFVKFLHHTEEESGGVPVAGDGGRTFPTGWAVVLLVLTSGEATAVQSL